MERWVVDADCHAATLWAVRLDLVGRPQGNTRSPTSGPGSKRSFWSCRLLALCVATSGFQLRRTWPRIKP